MSLMVYNGTELGQGDRGIRIAVLGSVAVATSRIHTAPHEIHRTRAFPASRHLQNGMGFDM
jgi:hypothetical protein